jgi:hypothetical protein
VAINENEPVGITILGGIKVTAMENTASFNFGENFLQSFDSQVKNNFINGNTFGDMTLMNLTSIASPVYDPDGVDTVMPVNMSPLGLED